MSKHWKDVKAAIEKDIDRIWFEEPEEVKMSRLGNGLVDCWPRHFGRSVR